MKKYPAISGGANSSHFSFLLLVLLVGCLPLRAAEVPSQPARTETKTHTLFMGADLSVEQNKTMYRVLDVQSGGFIIKVGGKEVRVAADWTNLIMKVDRTLKLTAASAAVTNLKSERAYTLGNDPTVKFQRGLAESEMSYADSVYVQRQAAGVLYNTEQVASKLHGPGAAAQAKKMIQAGQANVNKANAAPGSSLHNYEDSALVEGEGMFDAMDVTFEVSAPQPLNQPYVVFLGQYREKDSKPGRVANWIYAQPLQPIGAETKKIHIVRGGFPRGFEMQDFQVHLYNRGKEIATDVSPKRVPLTPEEAFLYARMEYLDSHKGATVPANPFMGKPDAEAKAKLGSEQWDQPYYVKVSKEGLPLAVFLDTNCSRPADDTVRTLANNVRFYPALESGKAVDGVAELKFSRLIL